MFCFPETKDLSFVFDVTGIIIDMSQYKIFNVIQQTQKVKVIQLQHLHGEEIVFLPGQYVDINFANDIEQSVDKYKSFSISSPPFERNILEIVVLDFGSFRHRVYNASIGTVLNVNGPYGRFIYSHDSNYLPVFLAGGSGIAPIMSMLRYIGKKYPEDIFILFYTCKTKKDIIFFKELKDIIRFNKAFQCHFVVTRDVKDGCYSDADPQLLKTEDLQDNSLNYNMDLAGENRIQWETGRIDEFMIARNIKDIYSKVYYICGPYEMMIMVNFILQKLGVDGSNIKSELW